jgi:hypothetical protein
MLLLGRSLRDAEAAVVEWQVGACVLRMIMREYSQDNRFRLIHRAESMQAKWAVCMCVWSSCTAWTPAERGTGCMHGCLLGWLQECHCPASMHHQEMPKSHPPPTTHPVLHSYCCAHPHSVCCCGHPFFLFSLSPLSLQVRARQADDAHQELRQVVSSSEAAVKQVGDLGRACGKGGVRGPHTDTCTCKAGAALPVSV